MLVSLRPSLSAAIVLFSVCLPLFSAHAKVFRNSYVSFELPPKWKCKIEGTEWVCNSTFRQQSREAVIILTAKEAGPSDNLAAYHEHLKQPRLIPTRSGVPERSKVIHVKRRNIANIEWVDGLHNGSEISNYYTRYLATVRENVAIIVSFSGHVKYYTKYSQDFFRAINSLRVVADKSLIGARPLAPIADTAAPLGAPPTVGDPFADTGFPDETSGSEQSGTGKMGLALLLLVGVAYYYLKVKKD